MKRKKYRDAARIAEMLLLIAAFVCFFFSWHGIIPLPDKKIGFALTASMLAAAATTFFFSERTYGGNGHQYKKDAETLEQLAYYTDVRKEIEEEIEYLTRQLTDSDIGQFLDIDRLAFQGQGTYDGETAIDIPKFLKRFGVRETEVKLEKNTAFMLTPFSEQGIDLFNRCAKIMDELNYRLRQSGMDSVPDKDDILMEIVTRIVQSEIILVNLNGRNPNVFYELGIAHALGKPTILLSERKDKDDLKTLNFDVNHRRIVFYDDDESLRIGIGVQVHNLKHS